MDGKTRIWLQREKVRGICSIAVELPLWVNETVLYDL